MYNRLFFIKGLLSSSFDFGRASPLNSFTFESDDEERRSSSRSPSSDKIKKSPSKITDPFMKRVSTQTPRDIHRSTSSTTTKQPSNALISTGEITRPDKKTQRPPPGISAARITEKEPTITYPSSSSPTTTHSQEQQQQRYHSSKSRKSNNKSQMVTYGSILQATRQQQAFDHSFAIDMKKVVLKKRKNNYFYYFLFLIGTSTNRY